jgi:biopolymer transport protein ExbB
MWMCDNYDDEQLGSVGSFAAQRKETTNHTNAQQSRPRMNADERGWIRVATLIVVLALAGCFVPRAVAQAPAVVGGANGGNASESQPAVTQKLTIWQIIFSGGPLGIANMVVLIALSITALALVADDLRLVRRSLLVPDGLSEDVRRLVSAGELAQAESQCLGRPSLLSAVILHGLSEAESGWSDVEKAMEDGLGEQAARLFRRIEYLNVIGNIAPMVGLLGTVTGMLLAFKRVAETEGNAGAAQLADGIYQALVTTVAGLIIAIPSLGAFALFRSRVDQLVSEAAYAALHALSPLKQRAAHEPPRPPSAKRA